MSRVNLDAAAERLIDVYGPDPQEVGAIDGTEDEYGDLLIEAAELLGHPFETMSDEDWQHFQNVAANAQATGMREWLEVLAAINYERETL